jgi:hypothetical protein
MSAFSYLKLVYFLRYARALDYNTHLRVQTYLTIKLKFKTFSLLEFRLCFFVS